MLAIWTLSCSPYSGSDSRQSRRRAYIINRGLIQLLQNPTDLLMAPMTASLCRFLYEKIDIGRSFVHQGLQEGQMMIAGPSVHLIDVSRQRIKRSMRVWTIVQISSNTELSRGEARAWQVHVTEDANTIHGKQVDLNALNWHRTPENVKCPSWQAMSVRC
jgi:hypothetical protein